MLIDNYKIIKKLDFGTQGVVFLIKYQNKLYIQKIEKILEKDISKKLSSLFWREIEFAKTIYNKHPLGFIKLYNYDIIIDHNFMLANPHKIKHIDEMNKSPYCSRKIYEFVEISLSKIIDKIKLKELYSILIQISYNIYIMNKNGYTHNDLHIHNIRVSNTKIKYIKIFNYQVPTFNYLIKFIDYGMVLHKKYKLHKDNIVNINEFIIHKYSMKNEIKRILDIVVKMPFYDTLPENFFSRFNFENLINKFLNSSDLILVDNLVKDKNDKFKLYEILYPERVQKEILGKKYKKVVKNDLKIPIEDYIFLLNATHITDFNDIKKIILYFIIKLL